MPKFCKIAVANGALRVEADGRTSFLGTAQVKAAGPLTLKLRARTTAGGEGKVVWKTADQQDFPKDGQSVPFKLEAGADWQDVTVALPIKGAPQIVRLYLPAPKASVEIESIQYFSADAAKPVRAWNFRAARK